MAVEGTGLSRKRVLTLWLALTLLMLCAPTASLAGPPVHEPLTAESIEGLNRACGAAVDSEGDVYASSAGESKVVVFNPEHDELASIVNAHEPCALALDGDGNLYVSERATGEVVRYHPTEYPFVGAPSYEAPVTIDASGSAKGIAVDPIDGRLYVAEGTRIAVYRFDGSFEAYLGEGELTDATGVGTYTYVYSQNNGEERGIRHLYVADRSDSSIKLFGGGVVGEPTLKADSIAAPEFRRSVVGPSQGEEFGFGSQGAYLSVDPGNSNSEGKCARIAEQACTAGHLFVYDDAHTVVDEFDAAGEFVDRIGASSTLSDGEPTAIAVDRSGGSNDGTIYVTSGAGSGAEVLAFSPLVQPGRRPLGQGEPPEQPSQELPTARAVATDSHGSLYAAAGKLVHIFDPSGTELMNFEDAEQPVDMSVDSAGNVYVLDNGSGVGTEKVTYYSPSSYPPSSSTGYTRHATLATRAGWPASCETPSLSAIGVDPANDHLFIATGSNAGCVRELGSAEEGSPVVDPEFGAGITASIPTIQSVDVCGKSGEVFFGGNSRITVINSAGTVVMARVIGAGSPGGPFSGSNPKIAVDQSNCHVLGVDPTDGAAAEYDSRGGFLADFGSFASAPYFDIASDGSCALHRGPGGEIEPLDETTVPTCAKYDPGNGRAYVADDEQAPNTPDIWAFGPLSYGEPPLARTSGATEINGGKVTLNGTVNPLGFELEECRFEYLTDAVYRENIEEEKEPFEGATEKLCAESAVAIGSGEAAVPVHVTVEGLDPEGRYRFRVAAQNKYGESTGTPGLFGPPVFTPEAPTPLYDEAVLRAKIEPAGLATSYRFECGPPGGNAGEYDRSTPIEGIPAGEGKVPVQAVVGELQEGATYHCRLVAENEAAKIQGEDQRFTTLQRRGAESCPNSEYRTGPSAALPDCRAYELVTPAQTGGLSPGTREASGNFNDWLTVPRGEAAGQRLSFFTLGTIKGFEGNGRVDGYLSERAAGTHPAAGWSTQLAGPTFNQASGVNPFGEGVSADQLYSTWHINTEGNESLPGTLAQGSNLRTPGETGDSTCNLEPLQSDFESVGCGDLGTDAKARVDFVSAGGEHVIFSSAEQLENEPGNQAPAKGTTAIYDRPVGSRHATVISVQPNGTPFSESATYIAASENGTSVVFEVGGILYEHREGSTVEVAGSLGGSPPAPVSFAGISEGGTRVLYAAITNGEAPAALYSCDTEAGPCAGSGAHAPEQIANSAVFVSVSPDASRVLFTSEEALTGSEENENCNPECEIAQPGAHNLYLAAGGTVHFVGALTEGDFKGFQGLTAQSLGVWTRAVNEAGGGERAKSPTRSTSNGGVFVFQSHAQLTSYDNEGKGEVYRYDPSAAEGERLLCVSCNPAEVPPAGEAVLQDLRPLSPVNVFSTLIANVTDDGSEVFFQTPDRLLPEDANEAQDVYEWRAKGTGEPQCTRVDGCLALISSGQDEGDSFLYSASADGSDVFFRTEEKLVGADVPGSKSIYDARVDGGIPEAPAPGVCSGDACQPEGSPLPVLPAPTSNGSGYGNVEPPRSVHCPKGAHKVRRAGKVRCVKRHRKARHPRAHRRGQAEGGGR